MLSKMWVANEFRKNIHEKLGTLFKMKYFRPPMSSDKVSNSIHSLPLNVSIYQAQELLGLPPKEDYPDYQYYKIIRKQFSKVQDRVNLFSSEDILKLHEAYQHIIVSYAH